MLQSKKYSRPVKKQRIAKRQGSAQKAVFLMLMLLVLLVTENMSVQAAAPTVTVSKKTLYVGYDNYQIKFKNLASTAKVSYKSSNKKVATVSSAGVIKPVAAGTAAVTITIKQSSRTYTRTIAVTVKKPYLRIPNKITTLVQSSDYLLAGKAYGFKDPVLTYTSSNVLVAKVGKTDGVLHARGAGKTKITMTNTTSGTSVSYTLTVVEKTEENAGEVYILTDAFDKSYTYTAPEDLSKLTEEEKAETEYLTDIQKRITEGKSITLQEMTDYYMKKNKAK